jgi:hypothetical protein
MTDLTRAPNPLHQHLSAIRASAATEAKGIGDVAEAISTVGKLDALSHLSTLASDVDTIKQILAKALELFSSFETSIVEKLDAIVNELAEGDDDDAGDQAACSNIFKPVISKFQELISLSSEGSTLGKVLHEYRDNNDFSSAITYLKDDTTELAQRLLRILDALVDGQSKKIKDVQWAVRQIKSYCRKRGH